VWREKCGGSTRAGDETGKHYTDFVSKNLRAPFIRSSPNDPLPSDAFRIATPAAICEYDLKQDLIGGWNYPGHYIGDPADFEDIVNFSNLRAANIGVLFLDNAQNTRLHGLWEAYLSVLRERPDDPPGCEPKACVWSKEGASVELAIFGGETIGRVE